MCIQDVAILGVMPHFFQHSGLFTEIISHYRVDKGHIYKLFTCDDAVTGLCPSYVPPFEGLIKLPASFIYSYDRSDILCIFTKTDQFSEYGDYEYMYSCSSMDER